MTQRCGSLLGALLGAAALWHANAPPVAAQRVTPAQLPSRSPLAARTVPVWGVVFDSLRGQPLRNAFVTVRSGIPGSGGTTVTRAITTEANGRFEFDSLPPGPYTFVAQHALLDSIGLSGLLTEATVADVGRTEVTLAVPSFATLWRAACSHDTGAGGAFSDSRILTRRIPGDSGIVYGTVRDVTTGAPVIDAAVELTWSDLAADRKRGVVVRQSQVDTRTNAVGAYAICGVPTELGLTIAAATDSATTGAIRLAPLAIRVERRDLLTGPGGVGASDSSKLGLVAGVVLNQSGLPAAGVAISVDGGERVRTDADGRFIVAGVHPGTRQLEARQIGAEPLLETVDVKPRDTAVVSLQLGRAVLLRGMRSSARAPHLFAAEFDARRKSGYGYSMDSTEVMKYDEFVNALRTVPSLDVQVRGGSLTITVPDGGHGGRCMPLVLIDGIEAAFGHLIDLFPKEVGGVEVYPRASHIPPRFAPAGVQPQCGMILVWTKYGFSNR